jgi:glycosyltransferase involved in cell wall biosynthesis
MSDQNNSIPWISFCMSTYRRPDILKKMLSLLRAQTFASFEVVISDNDPENSAEVIVAELGDSRFRYYSNGANLGMIGSFNKSITRSRGQFVVPITDDDPVYPGMVQTLYELSVRYPGYGMYAGGHDTVFTGLLQAQMAKASVGTNSALAQWDLGAEKTFSPQEFCQAFLDGTIGGSLLWSVCAIRRDIAASIGGIPDYGTPPLADAGFILLGGASAGLVYVNTALGYRTIHDTNYSYSETSYENIYKAPEGFYKWIRDHLPPSLNTPQLDHLLVHYIGRDMTIVVIAIKKMLSLQGVNSANFEEFRRRFFDISFLKKWKWKYIIATRFPNLFEFFLTFRKMLAPAPITKPGK